MKKQTRRKFTPEYKAKVALEAAKEQMTLSELAKKFEVNPVVISRWKSEFLSNIAAAFNDKPEQKDEAEKVDIEKLYAQIGQLKVENDFLKKNCKKLGIWQLDPNWLIRIAPYCLCANSVHYLVSIEICCIIILCLRSQRM